jgi:hypothetical protein
MLLLSLAMLVAGCLPPSADRNTPKNATSIDPALAFDNPKGDKDSFGNPAWGDPQFPNQPVEEFLTPTEPVDGGDSVAPSDPIDEPLSDLDLDLTLGTGDPELVAPEADVDLSLDIADDDKNGPESDDAPVDRNNLDDLYPDVDLPEKVGGAVADP